MMFKKFSVFTIRRGTKNIEKPERRPPMYFFLAIFIVNNYIYILGMLGKYRYV